MANVASVTKAIVLQLKALFSPVGIATTESNQDDQRGPDYSVFVCVCVCACVHFCIFVLALHTAGYSDYVPVVQNSMT